MKLSLKFNVGAYNSAGFESSEHDTPRECAEDILVQMRDLAQMYPVLNERMKELKATYGIV